MSNTKKIKNRKKKTEVNVNHKLLAIIFGVFIAAIVGVAVWASFHWGVGMGTVGVAPVTPDSTDVGLTDLAAEYATDGAVVVTPEDLEKMGYTVDYQEEGAEEGAEAPAAEDAGADAADVPAEEAGAEDAAAAPAEDAAAGEQDSAGK